VCVCVFVVSGAKLTAGLGIPFLSRVGPPHVPEDIVQVVQQVVAQPACAA
jgi:hypothetical protein